MSLQAILDKIRASGEAQIQEIERETQVQVSGILAQARMEAREIEEAAFTAASLPANAERARILHRAHLERLRIVGDTREALVDTALARTGERLASLRADACYRSVLGNLAGEALAELGSEGAGLVQLVADPRDSQLLSEILAGLKQGTPCNYELSCRGGVIARSEDGRVSVTNTLEARLERATPFLRSYLAALFEEKESAIRDLVHA